MSRRAFCGFALALAKLSALALTLALTLALATGCRGPAPSVLRQELRAPEAPGAPYRAIVTVMNKGGGEGQVAVTARLHAPGASATAAQAEAAVELGPRESLDVTIELRPSAPPPYELTVQVDYPPR